MKQQITYAELISQLDDEWARLFSSIPMDKISKLDEHIINAHDTVPPPEYIFRAFSFFPPADTKTIIVLQDPYPKRNLANGLAMGWGYSVLPSDRFTGATLTNFIEAMATALERTSLRGVDRSLISIAKQGVLLLNIALTTKVNDYTSPHMKYWRPIIGHVFAELTKQIEDVPILLLGTRAQDLTKKVAPKRGHKVFIEMHPSNRNVRSIENLKKSQFFAAMEAKGISWC